MAGGGEGVGGLRHERGVEGAAHRQGHDPAHPGGGCRLGGPLDSRGGAPDDQLPGGVVVGQPALPRGGAAHLGGDRGEVFNWDMKIQGSRERVLDSVLPHEITHTIFATHFGRPLPRWADEGACTTVEHPGEKAKQDKFLIQFMTPDARGQTRSIPFNRMFAMKEYPPDILPLYSRLSAAEQDRVFKPGKERRVVLATNVAETSLTVPRIRYVVDTGDARVKRYSYRNKVEMLRVEPISQAAAQQRAGRLELGEHPAA